MRSFFLLKISAFFIVFLGIANIVILRVLNPLWWKKRVIRNTIIAIPMIGMLIIGVWYISVQKEVMPVLKIFPVLSTIIYVTEVSLFVGLLLSGVVHMAAGVIEFFGRRAKNEVPLESRRNFLRTGAAVFPVIMVPTGLSGVAKSYNDIRTPTIKIPIADLPPQLENFKIAHLSDSHLGHYMGLEDLELAVEKLMDKKPDMVLVTGDIADDLKILPEALDIINSLRPPHGIFASVGNHEYYRGIERVLDVFAMAPFPMLINRTAQINIDGLDVVIGGADDPVSLRSDNAQFLEKTVSMTMGSVPREKFKILMSHRPEGFVPSSALGINLVLAGHTHGGQLGLAGRSLLEPLYPEKYLWGLYNEKLTTLYTTCGMGHWFPFRLGCPAEAPLLILERGNNSI